MDIWLQKTNPPGHFAQYLDTQLAASRLTGMFEYRLSLNPQDLLDQAGDLSHKRFQIAARLWGLPADHYLMARRNGSTWRANATYFGRHHFVIDGLKERLSDAQNLRILQGGAGLYRWHWLEMGIPSLQSFVEELAYQGDGISYEPAELTVLANSNGAVDVVELDERVVRGVKESLSLGLIVDRSQPLMTPTSRIEKSRVQKGESPAYTAWTGYGDRFIQTAARDCNYLYVRPKNGDQQLAGVWIKPHMDVASRVNVHQGDLATLKIDGTYDVAWLVNVSHYLTEPMLWSTLVRAISHLRVATTAKRGGFLVIERFDQHAFMKERPGENRLYDFLTLAGMSVRDQMECPMQFNHNVVIAERTSESEWIEELCRRIERCIG